MSCCDYTSWEDEELNHPRSDEPDQEPLTEAELVIQRINHEERMKERERVDQLYRDLEAKEIAQIKKDHEGFDKRLPYYLIAVVIAILLRLFL